MAAAKGHRIPNAPRGRTGPNKLTKSVKEAFEHVFKDLQTDAKKPYALAEWAKREPDKFYQLAAKLIPAEIKGDVNHMVTPNISLVVERMEARYSVNTEPQGIDGRKPD